jgi:hypothetical protein
MEDQLELAKRLRERAVGKETIEWRAAAELERIFMLHGPDGFRNRWVGACGHEWRKDQTKDCPICERAHLLSALNLARIVLKNRDRGETEERIYRQIQEVIAAAESRSDTETQHGP